MSQTAAQLAARTSSLLPRHATVSLELQNLTPIPSAEWSNFRSLLRDELRKAGVETAGAEPAATPPDAGSPARVRVTLSEDARGLLLVAEVFAGDNRQIAMVPWNLAPVAQAKPRITITTKASLGPGGAHTRRPVRLGFADVDPRARKKWPAIVSWGTSGYRPVQLRWSCPGPLPRDPRGRLAIDTRWFSSVPAGIHLHRHPPTPNSESLALRAMRIGLTARAAG